MFIFLHQKKELIVSTDHEFKWRNCDGVYLRLLEENVIELPGSIDLPKSSVSLLLANFIFRY